MAISFWWNSFVITSYFQIASFFPLQIHTHTRNELHAVFVPVTHFKMHQFTLTNIWDRPFYPGDYG